MAFDPYHTWLGIRPDEQPPNHYRLLGLSLFEDSPAVIDNAADRQMSHVRTFQTGPHAAASQRLLSEITLARICLVNPQKRAAYDAELRRALPPPPPQPPLAETQPIVVEIPRFTAGEHSAGPPVVDHSAADVPFSARKQKNPAIEIAKIVAGGLAGIVISVLLLRYVALIDITGLLPVPKKTDSRQVVERPHPIEPSGTPITTENAVPTEPGPPLTTASDEENPSAVEGPGASKPGKKKKAKKQAPTPRNVPSSPPSSSPMPAVSEPMPPSEAPMSPPRPSVLLAKRLPAPTAPEQEAIKKTLEELFGISKLKTEAEKLKVAGDLRGVARDAKEKPAEQFVAFRQAAELALDVGDAKLLVECIAALAQRFEFDLLQVEVTMLAECAKNARTAEAIESLVLAARPVVLFALSEGELELAKRLTDATMTACARPNGLKYRRSVNDGQKEINRQYGAWQAYQQAQKKLAEQPDDPTANLAVGKWHCLERADWTSALPYLARAGHPDMQKAAELELAKSGDAAAQLATADAWYVAGTSPPKEPLCLLRARLLYEQAKRGELDGLAAARVDRRLDELLKDDSLKPLVEGFDRAAARGRLRPDLSPIVRRHCVLAFTFEPGDVFYASGKSMLRDLSGQENHGAIYGTTPVAGRAGSAFEFQTVEDFVESPDQPSLNPSASFTVCAWIFQHSAVRPGGADDILSKEEFGGGTGSGFSLRLHDRRPDINFGSGPEWLTVRAPQTAETGRWMHLVGVYDGQHEVLVIDGAEVASAPCTKPMSVSPRPLRVGRGPFAQDRRFHGIIDEVAFFDTALTAEEIRLIYGLGNEGKTLAR